MSERVLLSTPDAVRRGRKRRAFRRDDESGAAMIIAVMVSALIATVAAALLISLTTGPRSALRQREFSQARLEASTALEYLNAHLMNDTDFFEDMLATTSPTTYTWIDDDLSAATGQPDPATITDWTVLGDESSCAGNARDCNNLRPMTCSSLEDPCWTLRFKPSPATAGSTPTSVVVEAIVRFSCRKNADRCQVRRFQQQLTLRSTDWVRLDMFEVTQADRLA